MKRLLNGDRGVIAGLLLLFLVAEALINPVGEFPLNDDWSYTRSLLHLYQNHELVLGGFTSMPLVTQLWWAWGFCKVFGFSFTIVRISTLALSFAGVLFSYYLVKELSGSRRVAVLGALVLLFNPIYLNLSNTYMTDVPFVALLTGSIFFFVRSFRREQRVWLIAGILLVTAATMVRQLGLLVAFSFSGCYWLWGRGSRVRRFLIALLVSGFPLLAYLSFSWWLKHYSQYPAMYDEGTKQIFYHLFRADYSVPVYLIKQIFNILIYTGFFLFPFILVYNRRRMQRDGWTLTYYYLFFLLLVGGYFLVFRRLMPYTGNILTPYGLGIVTLRDVMILKLANLHPLPGLLWVLITLMGGAGAGMLVYVLRKYLPSWRIRGSFPVTPPELIFLWGFVLFYSAVMVVGGAFDRYLLPLLPVACGLVGYKFSDYISVRRSSWRIAFFVLALYAVFSVSLTADYLSWNRARWTALNFLMRESHVSPEQIDGGFEFNGFYLYDNTRMDFQEDPDKKSWWWVKDDAYMIGFGPVKGYRVVKEYDYPRMLHLASGKVFLLQRENPQPANGVR